MGSHCVLCACNISRFRQKAGVHKYLPVLLVCGKAVVSLFVRRFIAARAAVAGSILQT